MIIAPIKIKGIIFLPYYWDTEHGDGIFGHIFLKTNYGFFQYVANNGAYCRRERPLDPKKISMFDVVEVATPCMEYGEELDTFDEHTVYVMAALFAYQNLLRKP